MRVLIVSPLPSFPILNGAKQRIATLGALLKERGHTLHYVYYATEGLNYSQLQGMKAQWASVSFVRRNGAFERSLGDHFGIDDWCQPQLVDHVRDAVDLLRCDTVLVNYVFLSKVLECLPDHVQKLIDTHDRMSGRLELYQEIGAEPGFFYTTEEQEAIAMRRADTVIAIQDIEADFFRSLGAKHVEVIGHVPDRKIQAPRPTDKLSFGFLGSANKFNIASVNELLAALKRLPSGKYEMLLGGSICNVIDTEGYDVTKLGFVDELEDYYRQIDVAIVPLIVGTGQKIKTVEALAFGKPVLSTEIGFDGLKPHHRFHACSGIHQLVEAMEQLIIAPESISELRSASLLSFDKLESETLGTVDQLFPTQKAEDLRDPEVHYREKAIKLWQQCVDNDFNDGNNRKAKHEIMQLLDELVQIQFLRNPVKKYKKYKELAIAYQNGQVVK